VGLGSKERIDQEQGEFVGMEIGRLETDEGVRDRELEVSWGVEVELIWTASPSVESARDVDGRRSLRLVDLSSKTRARLFVS
jgi:hypothetical protein